MNYLEVCLGLAVISYVLHVQIKLIKSAVLNKGQKVYNSILLWLIPGLWAFIVNIIIKRPKKDIVIKSNRKLPDQGFYESGTGVLGD